MGVYDSDIASALESIREAGETSVLRSNAPGVENPDKPWLSVPAVPTNTDVAAVWLNYNLQGAGQTQDSLVKASDKKVLVAASGAPEITTSDQLVRADGSVWKIENVKLLDPNGERILYELQARQ